MQRIVSHLGICRKSIFKGKTLDPGEKATVDTIIK